MTTQRRAVRLTGATLLTTTLQNRGGKMKRCGEYRTNCKLTDLCKQFCIRVAMEQHGFDLVDGMFVNRNWRAGRAALQASDGGE